MRNTSFLKRKTLLYKSILLFLCQFLIITNLVRADETEEMIQKAADEAMQYVRKNGNVVVRDAVKKTVGGTGQAIITNGSWEASKGYTPGLSDQDARVYTLKNVSEDEAVKIWKNTKSTMRKEINDQVTSQFKKQLSESLKNSGKIPSEQLEEIVNKASQKFKTELAGEATGLISRTNVYPSNELVKYLKSDEEAFKYFQKWGIVPGLGVDESIQLTDDALKKEVLEGLWGKGKAEKLFTQGYESKKGAMYYVDEKTGKVIRGSADLAHMAEEFGVTDLASQSQEAIDWVKRSCEKLEGGKLKAALKDLERVHANIKKAKDLAGIVDPNHTGLQDIVAEFFDNNGKLKLESEFGAEQVEGKLKEYFKNNPAAKKEIERLLQNAERNAKELLFVGKDANELQRIRLRKLMSNKQSAGIFQEFMETMEKYGKPAEIAIQAFFVYWDAREMYTRSGEKDIDGAARKQFEMFLGLTAELGPTAVAVLTNLVIDSAKEAGFQMAVASQDCGDLLEDIISVKGCEGATERAEKTEITIDKMAKTLTTEDEVRAIVALKAYNALSAENCRGMTEEVRKKEEGALTEKCTERIVGWWRQKRTEMLMKEGGYFTQARLLDAEFSNLPLVLKYEPDPAVLMKAKNSNDDTNKNEVEVTLSLQSISGNNIDALLKKMEDSLSDLGGKEKLITVHIKQQTQWSVNGEKILPLDESFSPYFNDVISKKNLTFNKAEQVNVKCEISWSVNVLSRIMSTETKRNYLEFIRPSTKTSVPVSDLTTVMNKLLSRIRLPGWETRVADEGDIIDKYRKEMDRSYKMDFEIAVNVVEQTGSEPMELKIIGPDKIEAEKTMDFRLDTAGVDEALLKQGKFIWSDEFQGINSNISGAGGQVKFTSSKYGPHILSVELRNKIGSKFETIGKGIKHIEVAGAQGAEPIRITGPDTADLGQLVTLQVDLDSSIKNPEEIWVDWIPSNRDIGFFYNADWFTGKGKLTAGIPFKAGDYEIKIAIGRKKKISGKSTGNDVRYLNDNIFEKIWKLKVKELVKGEVPLRIEGKDNVLSEEKFTLKAIPGPYKPLPNFKYEYQWTVNLLKQDDTGKTSSTKLNTFTGETFEYSYYYAGTYEARVELFRSCQELKEKLGETTLKLNVIKPAVKIEGKSEANPGEIITLKAVVDASEDIKQNLRFVWGGPSIKELEGDTFTFTAGQPQDYNFWITAYKKDDKEKKKALAQTSHKIVVSKSNVKINAPSEAALYDIITVSAELPPDIASIIKCYNWSGPGFTCNRINNTVADTSFQITESGQKSIKIFVYDTSDPRGQTPVAEGSSEIFVKPVSLSAQLPANWEGAFPKFTKTVPIKTIYEGKEIESSRLGASISIELHGGHGKPDPSGSPITISKFKGFISEGQLLVKSGGWTPDGSSNSWVRANGTGILVYGDMSIDISYSVSGSSLGSFPDQTPFLKPEAEETLEEIKSIISGFNFVPDGKVVKKPPKDPAKDLKVKLTAAETKLKKGDIVEVEAVVENTKQEDNPLKYTWSGDHEGSGDKVRFLAAKPGKYTLSAIVESNQNANGSASIEFNVEGEVKVEIIKFSPAGNTMPVGSKATFNAKAVPAGREYVYRWEPYPAITFEPHEGTSSQSIATFSEPCKAKVWVTALEKKDGILVPVGESDQLEIDVIKPEIKVFLDTPEAVIGQNIKANVTSIPPVKDIDFRWELTNNAKLVSESQDAAEITFTINDDKPVTIIARARVPVTGEGLGEAQASITAKQFKITAEVLGSIGSKPMIWKPGIGLVEESKEIAVFQDVRLKASIEPAPQKSPVKFRWTLNEDSHFAGGTTGNEVTVNRSQTGECVAEVEVEDSNGLKLGKAAVSFSVTISQDEIRKSSEKNEAAKKVGQAKEIVRLGKLDEAIELADEAVKLDPKNSEGLDLAEKLKKEKSIVLSQMDRTKKLMEESRFPDADAELIVAMNLHGRYQPVVALEQKLKEDRSNYNSQLREGLIKVMSSNEKKEFSNALKNAEQLRAAIKLHGFDDENLKQMEQWARSWEANKEVKRNILKMAEEKFRNYDYEEALRYFDNGFANFENLWSAIDPEPEYYNKLKTETFTKNKRLNEILPYIRSAAEDLSRAILADSIKNILNMADEAISLQPGNEKFKQYKELINARLKKVNEDIKKEKPELTPEVKPVPSLTDNNVVFIKELYNNFKQAYESRNGSQVMGFMADEWEAGDGTTLSDLEVNLSRTFKTFDEIKYNIQNLNIQKTQEGKYKVTYDVTITSKIYKRNIKHEEKSDVNEEVTINDSGKPKISRTLSGRFWYIE